MADHNDSLTVVRVCDPLECRAHPPEYVVAGLAIGYTSIQVAVDDPCPEHGGGFRPYGRVDAALVRTDADLDQVIRSRDWRAGQFRNDGGGLAGAQRGAAVNGGNRRSGKSPGGRSGLRVPNVGQRRVRHCSGSSTDNVRGFGVPHAEKADRGHAPTLARCPQAS